jgi:light-harvesting complex I chlorophyll a/b binding protein 1
MANLRSLSLLLIVAAAAAAFTGGARAPPKKAPKAAAKAAPKSSGKVKSQGLFSSGVATKKAPKSKRSISTSKVSQTYIDVTGNAYQEINANAPKFDEIGVLPPLGRWDPLQIREQGPERYRRFVEMEIKHGRLSMAAFLGVITTYSGIRWPGYLSKAEGIKFSDLPGGAISSWAALPTAAWFHIVLFISICEVLWLKQDPAKAPGDVVPEGVAWARYPDGYDVWLGDGSTKQVGEDELILGKTWKLNAERNNGRAAMMGITGMIIHEALTGNPVFPIGETL